MKKIVFFLMIWLTTTALYAQSEVPSDSIRRVPNNYKEIGGFLIDMGLMSVAPSQLFPVKMELPHVSTDYNQLFKLNPNATYSQGFTRGSLFASPIWGIGTGSTYMQMGSFQLKNGMRMNTYGDYNKEGYRVLNPSALPWERNNFRGAFELKSANGNFGIRIEVQQGRNSAFPY